MPEGTFQHVALNEIDPGKRYREHTYNLVDMVTSIKKYGVFTPVTLLEKASVPGGVQHEKDESAPFMLIAGGRRFYGSQGANKETVPAYIRTLQQLHMTKEELEEASDELIELKIRELESEENLQREDLNDAEQVALTREIHRIKQKLYGDETFKKRSFSEKPGWSMGDTARLTKKSRAAVSIDIALADAADEDPDVAEALKISKAEARKLIKAKERKQKTAERVKAIKKKKASTAIDLQRRKLAESYIKADFFKAIQKEESSEYGLIELDPDWAINVVQSYDATTRNSRPTDIDEYQEITPEEYAEKMGPALEECYRVLKPNGWLILWFGAKDKKEINVELLKKAGFSYDLMPALWVKDLGAGFTRNPAFNLSFDYETFLYARKGSANIQKRGHSNIFPYKRVAGQKKIMRFEKPVELYQEIFGTFTMPGTPTLVGFAGSGNALLAGSNLGADVKGFDLSESCQKEYILRVYAKDKGPYRSHEPGKARLFGLSNPEHD